MMVDVLTKHYRQGKVKGGRTRSLVPSDELLLTLEYYREYRTFKHLSVDYEVSESTAHYVVTKVEKLLIKDQRFHLSPLKHTKPSDTQTIDVVVVDVTESPCERPKKSNETTIQVRKKDIR
jgi:hypothetical protein